MDQGMVSATAAAKMLGVSTRTLRWYTQRGVLTDRRSPGGRRVFSLVELEAVGTQRGKLPPAQGLVLYGRVCSQRQRAEGDLERRWPGSAVPLRAGSWSPRSGMSVRACPPGAAGCAGRYRRASVRRCRCSLSSTRSVWPGWGVGMIRDVLLPAFGVALEIAGTDEDLDASRESELVRDMLAVVASLSGRWYGQRSAKQHRMITCAKQVIATV